MLQQIVDLDSAPLVPIEGWTVVEHVKGGLWEFDPSEIVLFLADRQKGGESMVGHDLRRELAGQPVMNANLADWLLAHLEMIPSEWEGKVVCFWGTIYRGPNGTFFVRCLSKEFGKWDWGCRRLGISWSDNAPAVIRR